MTGKTRISLAVFALLALIMGGAALAWACTPDASIAVSPNVAPPGTNVTIDGNKWGRNEPITLSLQSATEAYALGSVQASPAGNFSIAVAVPEHAPDGTYTLVAEAEYTPPEEEHLGTRYPASDRQYFAIDSSRPVVEDTDNTVSGGSGQPSSVERDLVTGGRDPAAAAGTERGARAESRMGAAEASSVFAESVPPPDAPPVPGRTGTKAAEGATVSARTATGDLGSGFASGGPSLLPAATQPAPDGSANSPRLIFGVALLAFGLLSAGGALMMAELRRRRVRVTQ